eukprot:scaffold9254_cov50-Phaeocystis_antarctica.AAC.3
MPPTTVPGVGRVTVSRTAEVAMVRTSASAPGVQQISASAGGACGGWYTACLGQHGAERCTNALLRHASAAGGGGWLREVGGAEQRSSCT